MEAVDEAVELYRWFMPLCIWMWIKVGQMIKLANQITGEAQNGSEVRV